MKKILLLSAFLVGSLLIFKPAEAQFRVHVNINPFPTWRPVEHYNDWHRPQEVFVYNDRRDRHYRYSDRRDWNNRDWRHHDNDRRHDDGRGRNDRSHGDAHRDGGRGRW